MDQNTLKLIAFDDLEKTFDWVEWSSERNLSAIQ